MKKIFLIAIALLASSALFAQIEPDAEYNLIRRSYTVNPDGSMDINFRKEIKLIRNRAITAYADKGETFITYNPQFETLTINECYTIMADGTKVVTPQNAFVQQLPSECTECGRLNGIREMAIVHTALEYNCVIVLDYTIHRNSSLYVERFNFQQDCPVKRYEVRYADGHTQTLTDLSQTVSAPYMPAKNFYDVEFQLGQVPTYTAAHSLPQASAVLNALRKDDVKAYVTAIRDWVVDYVHLSTVDLSHVNYVMTPAAEVFNTNCGTILDKTGLLAAMLNEAGFRATIVDNSVTTFGDRPMEVELTLEGKTYRLSAIAKGPLMTETEKADAQAVANAAINVERELEWNPQPISEGYVRISLPTERGAFSINPAYLTPSRTSNVQAKATTETYHYTLTLPKGAKLMGKGHSRTLKMIDEKSQKVWGSVSTEIYQKGRKVYISRHLQLDKPIITADIYESFRQLMIEWNNHKELIFSL